MKGFSLIEVLVAMALVASSAAGLAGLFTLASRVTQEARIDTGATFAAETKLAELRALTWVYDSAHGDAAVSDAGLTWSPASTLTDDVEGFVDYVDATGQLAGGTGASSPLGVYRRRWSIRPAPADPANTLVLQVVAARVTRPQAKDAHLISLLARTAQ